MPPLTRRELFQGVGAMAMMSSLPSWTEAVAASTASVAQLHWIDATAPGPHEGATWGTAWPRGVVKSSTALNLVGEDGNSVPVQSWTLATWPDGSIKWSGHAIAANAAGSATLQLKPGRAAKPTGSVSVQESADEFVIDTGVIRCRVARSGQVLIRSIERDGKPIATDGVLICRAQTSPDDGEGDIRVQAYSGAIEHAELEQKGPLRTVVKLSGQHVSADRQWLPFVLRLYFHAGAESIRVLHSFIFDGEPKSDFIRALGLSFSVPMRDELYDRHIRFTSAVGGVFAEAVRGLTGLRRDPGDAVRNAQFEGRPTPPVSTWPETVSKRLDYIPAFGDYTLTQPNAEGYTIRKRTKAGYTWIGSDQGGHAGGIGYIGGISGGLAVGLRHFRESHPTQIDIRNAASDKAGLTLWLWSPESPPMDLRGYHDDMGMDDYAGQIEGLEITYEDYEPGFDVSTGIARSSELFIWALAATPTQERFAALTQTLAAPPRIVPTPAWLKQTGVFGGLFSLPDRSTPAAAAIEDRLDEYFDFYKGQVEQHHWLGFWNHGDVMHTYDATRHVWRYDVGGFAWDNSELSSDLWLWTYYLRSGRADVFRMAEAMTRHTGEVDVYHSGRFAPLGSRHNVLHYGCSAKQMRISTAANRRYYYYLAADERVGDLMHEQVEAVRKLAEIQPGRKLPGAQGAPGAGASSAMVNFGTDWGAVSAAWLTEWERTGSKQVLERLKNSMRGIAEQPHGFFTGGAVMDFDSGRYEISHDTQPHISHLSAVFGLFEMCTELLQLIDMPEFRKAWLDYCRLYDASKEQKIAELGSAPGGVGLRQGHARLTALAARELHDPALAHRAWSEFYGGGMGIGSDLSQHIDRIDPPWVTAPVEEIPWISTNAVAQWGLAAMQTMALLGEPEPSA